MAQINITKHNLSAVHIAPSKRVGGTPALCAFCHSQSGSGTSFALPLWNHFAGGPTAYRAFNSLGTFGLDDASAPVGSVSLACLSCHDGALAMNVTINTPDAARYRLLSASTPAPVPGSLQAMALSNSPRFLTSACT